MGGKIRLTLQLVFSFVFANGIMAVRDINHSSLIDRIKTADVDVFDCVDIYSQPAFDHPLLKNHIIQTRPSSVPGGGQNTQYPNSHGVISSVNCPLGTIPVRRHDYKTRNVNHREILTSMTSNITTILMEQQGRPYHAAHSTQGEFKGSKASITVYEPEVKEGTEARFSGATIIIGTGDSRVDYLVSAGWFVDQETYGDRNVRFSISWKDHIQNRGCVDLNCPGFVHVNSDIPLGARINPVSTYNGKQYAVTIMIFQDSKTENWWVTFGEDQKIVGYWPKSLVPELSNKDHVAVWEGKTYSPSGESSPPMGSGHFPSEGYGKAAYFENILVVDNTNNLIIPDTTLFWSDVDNTKCYDVGELMIEKTGVGFFFGGPGGCN